MITATTRATPLKTGFIFSAPVSRAKYVMTEFDSYGRQKKLTIAALASFQTT